MIKKLIYTLHRFLGTALSLLFLMWFLSGLVMIYHGFPQLTEKETLAHMPSLHPADTVVVQADLREKLTVPGITSLVLSAPFGHALLTATPPLFPHPELENHAPSFAQIEAYARTWSHSPIIRTDTLRHLEQWIPYDRLRADFPIYKFYFADSLKSQLYVSSVTGKPLQFTNHKQRCWAYFGAIPHWIYFTRLRQDVTLWKNTLIILAAIGCLVCLTGLFVGIRAVWKSRRLSPYRRPLYRWHHVLGFFFGFFVLSFIFSGLMSLAQVPRFIVKVNDPQLKSNAPAPKPIAANLFRAGWGQLLEAYPRQVKEIKWLMVGGVPAYQAVIGNGRRLFDASQSQIRPLRFTPGILKEMLSLKKGKILTIDTLRHYDNYYADKSGNLPLPVYKISVDDADRSTYYVDPLTGKTLYFNTNERVHHWVYQIPHSFESGFFVRHGKLRAVLLWVVLLGGSAVSGTGVWLGVRFVRRKIRKKQTSGKSRR